MTDKCTTLVRGGDTWHPTRGPCGRPSKGTLANGEPACGIHLRSEKQRADQATARREWEDRKERVATVLAITVVGWEVGRKVSVSLEDLERLAGYGT